MPVHLYGQPCDMTRIMEIAQKHRLAVIEDACQAHGAEYRGKKAGSFGTGCFSFYPTKNMITGEGGMITTDDEDIARKARMIRNHGQLERYLHTMLGYNYRLTDIAAAIGLCQLARLPGFTDKRIANAAFLSSSLRGVKGLVTPQVSPGVKHVFHQYTVRITPEFPVSRDELRKRLLDEGVGTEVYYPRPVHQQPFYRQLGYEDRLPVSEQAAGEVLSLPVHPSLTEEDLAHIVRAIRSV
jgi:perosamine synthetase